MWHTGNLLVGIKMTVLIVAGLRIGYKNDCEMRVEKGNVGPWNIDLTNK